MDSPDSPPLIFHLELDNVESSNGEAQPTASRPVNAGRLQALLTQAALERSTQGVEQLLSRFASPSSSPFFDASEEHLDALSSTANSPDYNFQNPEITGESAPPPDSPDQTTAGNQVLEGTLLSTESQAARPVHLSPSGPGPAPSRLTFGAYFPPPMMNTFGTFNHGHHDIVQAIHYNFYGNRMLTASSDHHLKVWNKKGEKDWELVDTWRGHDAEIMDAKWCGPFTGEVLASIGQDNMFRVWEEDVTQAPKTGRRFKCIYSQQTKFHVPYVSMDIRAYSTETHVALITRDGYLTLLEPTNTDSLGDWREIDQFYVCPRPSRGEETGFTVAFHQDSMPSYKALDAGLDRNALSLAVAAMDVVKVYRATKSPGNDSQLYLAAVLPCPDTLIRDVAWAAGSFRGNDTIATACKDGFIRIFEVTTPVPSRAKKETPAAAASTINDASSSTAGTGAAPSGISAGLAGASRGEGARPRREEYACKVKHTWKEVACLDGEHGAVWRVKFTRNTGDALVSGADDGVLRMWKRATTGEWMEFAEVDPTSYKGE